MSNSNPPTSKRRISWLSRLQKRVSSPFSSPSSSSPCLPRDRTESLQVPDIPTDCADTDVSAHSTTNSIPADRSPSTPPPLATPHLHPPYAGKTKALAVCAGPEPAPSSVSHRTSISSSSVHTATKSNHTPHPLQTSSSCLPDSLFQQYPSTSDHNTARIDTSRQHNDTLLSSTSQRPSSSTAALPRLANSNPSPLLPPSSSVSPLSPQPSGASLDVPHRSANTELLHVSPSHSSSVSRASTPSPARSMGADPTLTPQHPIRHLEDPNIDPNSQPYTSAYLTPPNPPLLHQGQALTYQGSSHMFGEARNFTVKDSTFIQSTTATDNFMEKLFQETIIGAEFDSSARDPPPRCHPGTRLAIIQRCLDFIVECHDEEKLRWVVGPAGVGKSAIMQMVTENAPGGIVFASIFLSVNGRRDGSKTVLTIAYQLAVKCGPYRQFVRDQIGLDPSLLYKSLSVQFNKFIVEPFMLGHLFKSPRRFLIVVDGLDECDNRSTQRELLKLITDFCIAHSTSPIAWIIASRPEPHITSFFDDPKVEPAFTKEEMVIDSDEACEEVQRYLRDELKQIQFQYPTLRRRREWPLEHEFTKIASAAGGLFAYAATVIRYIGDPTIGGPAAQLRRVIDLIDASAKDIIAGKDHPMDRLDALYRRILSNASGNVTTNTRKLLLLRSHYQFDDLGFRGLSNVLGLTEDEAYDAICHLHAVMKIPEPDDADKQILCYHKSFDDFLWDFERSGFSRAFQHEGLECSTDASLRIIEEAHADGVSGGEDIRVDSDGLMNGHCNKISLSWPGDEHCRMTDEEIRIKLYRKAVHLARTMFFFCDGFQKSVSCFHVLTTSFVVPPTQFPFNGLRDGAFDQFRAKLITLDKLKQMPLRSFDYAAVCGDVELQFTSATGSDVKVSDFLNAACEHSTTVLRGLHGQSGWTTSFRRYLRVDSGTRSDEDADITSFHVSMRQPAHEKWYERDRSRIFPSSCVHCSRRFARYFMNNPDISATFFVDGAQMAYVEVTFVDPNDGVSEWRYRFLHSGCPSSNNV